VTSDNFIGATKKLVHAADTGYRDDMRQYHQLLLCDPHSHRCTLFFCLSVRFHYIHWLHKKSQ